MFVLLGLVLLIAALVIGVSGVVANEGAAHELSGGFSVFGYDFSGSTGTLFLYGIVVGAVGLLGLSLLLAGVRRASHRGIHGRPGPRMSRHDTLDRGTGRDDDLNRNGMARPPARGDTGTAAPGDDQHDPHANPDAEHRRGRNPFRH
ncbi:MULTISPECIES: hypothetical protein [unclassified Streptomyces]|uniref:hypothetical protein n=1 Tax=unclassified Streptomyces TaxID=2593676 RepID=UPI0033F86E1B